jgi:hypothetical protein
MNCNVSDCNCGCYPECNSCGTSKLAFKCPPSYNCVWVLKKKGQRVSTAFELLHYGQSITQTTDFGWIRYAKNPPIMCHLGFGKNGKLYINDKPVNMYWKQKGNNVLLYGKSTDDEFLMTQCQSEYF